MAVNKSYLPPEWGDTETMDVLFSPFRENREVNPQSWDSKMKFWEKMIYDECRFSRSSIVNLINLKNEFSRGGKMPVCLGKVLEEMYRQGKIQRLSDFKASINVGWVSWSMDILVKKPLVWTFSKIFGYSNTNLAPTEDFIVPEMLEEQAQVVLEHHYRSASNDTTDHIVEYTELLKQMADVCPDQRNLDLVIMLLCKQKKAAIASSGPDSKTVVVRFAKKNKSCVAPVSELDLRIIRLQKAEAYLQDQVLQIPDEMERCREDARLYLKKGLRNSAKHALRRKKTMERILAKREAALENIQALLHRIKEAESDKMILDAYSDGTAAFKNVVANTGLNVDRIDDVMVDLQEVFDMQDEINASISQGPTDPQLNLTTAELEAELEDILSDPTVPDKNVPETEGIKVDSNYINDFDLPSVPTFDPSKTPPNKDKSGMRSLTLTPP